mgnify:CR=1 FL=1
MALERLSEKIPEYASDLKLNLSSFFLQSELSEQQTWGTAVACACACSNGEVVREVISEAGQHLSPQALRAARAAAAIMGMNNIYYRFQHLSSNEKYRTMPARLRMNILRSHGANEVDFELWCLAVSALNGCATCVEAHERVLREKGLSEEQILGAVRIAAVIHAVAAVLHSSAFS